VWYKPHRNVQHTKVFAELNVKDLVNEFTGDESAANSKYLASDGNSKVLVVKGRITKISLNQQGETVVILKEDGLKAGVSATFIKKANTTKLKIGEEIKIKGAITAGSRYDEVLDLYEHAVMIQCTIY
jgi:hypothetical protein